MEKNQLDIRMLNFMRDILEKKKKKKIRKISKQKKARPTLKTFSRVISSHIINFRFLPFSGHFRKAEEKILHQVEAEKLAAAGEKKNFADISRGNDFMDDPEKSLFRYINKTNKYININIWM